MQEDIAMINKEIHITSETFPPHKIDQILDATGVFHAEGHFLYPADVEGAHLLRFFSIEPIAQNKTFLRWIVEDIMQWAKREDIFYDVIFCPDQSGVVDIADEIARASGARIACWEYDSQTGRFGSELVEGSIHRGERVLVFNGVTQQGRCVGQRLPDFVETFGGEVVGAAVFAKGTTGLVEQTEKRYGSLFYAAIQVDIPVYASNECPRCLAGDKDSLQPWTDLLAR
jgi:orotate phosphoribosyltransferase